jgi:alkylation response protein AidB-like acyl-CoA dehydrogenase
MVAGGNAMHATQDVKSDVKTIAPAPADLIARARALTSTLAARALKAEQDRRVPAETIADMQAAGLFRVFQPKRWGGYEMDPATYFEIQLALAEGCMSTGWVYGVVGLHPWLMGLFDDRAAQEVWGTDDATLICSSLMPTGTAVSTPGGFRLSGRRRKVASRAIAASFSFRAAPTRSRTPGVCPASRRPAATTSW